MPLRRHLIVALLLAVGSLAPSAVYADDPEPEVSDTDPEADAGEPRDVWDSLLQLSITGGLDTPFGLAGGAIEFTPYRYITIYAGGGVNRFGGHVAGGLRINMPLGNAAAGLMAGVGAGSLDWDSDIPDGTLTRRWDFAFDIHIGVTFEYRWENGLFGRLAFGAQGVIDQDADSCSMSVGENEGVDCTFPTDILAEPIWGWAGLTVGYALDL